MDAFREKQQKQCAVGGFRCPCCNPHFGKDKYKLNKIARLKLKREDRKHIEDDRQEQE
jgi:hypothetical protein